MNYLFQKPIMLEKSGWVTSIPAILTYSVWLLLFIVVSLAKVSHQLLFALFFIPCLVFPLSKLLVKSHCWLYLPWKAQHPCGVWNPPMYCLGCKKRCWEGPGPQLLATLCHLVHEGILLVSKISPNPCKQWFHRILALLLPTIEIDPHWPRARYKRCGLVHLSHRGTEVGWWCSAESSKESTWRVLNMGLKWDISVVPGTWCLWLDSSGKPFTLQLLVSLSDLILSHHM